MSSTVYYVISNRNLWNRIKAVEVYEEQTFSFVLLKITFWEIQCLNILNVI